jgi:hypothetical protein
MKHIVALSAVATSSLLAADNNELSRQATDPTTSLMALNFQSTYTGDFHGAGIPGEADDAWIFQFRPVIPFTAFERPNILDVPITRMPESAAPNHRCHDDQVSEKVRSGLRPTSED